MVKMKTIKLGFVKELKKQIFGKGFPLIQVIIGPRQVGKTTGVKQLLRELKKQDYLYYSADGDIQKPSSWLSEKWLIAQSTPELKLLVIDEVQNIESWSSTIKMHWDEQADKKKKIKLILLGSSSMSIHTGLSESLAGRFLIHNVYHWSFQESKEAYGLTFEQFLKYGGYPGSYNYIEDTTQWLNYIKNSIIDPVIGKDILTQVRVKSPALFKQCFMLATSYPAQEISYTKLLGQLQDKGNTDQVKQYLEHFEAAFLLKQLFKYSEKKTLQRSSSPKILPLCPALYTSGLDADLNSEERGRCFEVAVGATLLRLPGELFYWREKNFEVDFVYKFGKKLIGIEVKSGRVKKAKGLMAFKKQFPHAELIIVTPTNFLKLTDLIEGPL